ncbi:CocE/NonD family hydrolase [Mycobacterium sp. URHB0044]|uniref:CocE/NonD family hydrolase n=1 Tax=Mycobacterium sp. URHB0044 TaxID=1380386 RepID=UPI00048F658A|nr:CocE/NonD family hydrolase [Mycobacterium sp. URHB0044]
MYDVTVQRNVAATMRDGTVLRADVYRPTEDGPWPVLLTRLPYGKHLPGFLRTLIDPLGMASGGYLVVVQDTRGRFASEGNWEPWTFEADDGYDSVRWAAALPGSNGVVGMFGASYFGNTQWMAALSKPPELKAISPVVTWSDPDDGLFSRGGVLELGTSVYWSLLQGAQTLVRRHSDDPAALGGAIFSLIADIDGVARSGYSELPAEHHPAYARHDIAELGFERSQREPEWSASCRVAGRHAEVDLPSLQIGGWYDLFCQGTLDNFTGMHAAGRPATLIMGPWAHTNTSGYLGDVNFGLASSAEILGFRGSLTDIQTAWFRHHLVPAADENASAPATLPPVLLFVMGTNQWREEREWPLSRAMETDLFLRADGQLTAEPPAAEEAVDTYRYDPTDPVITIGGALLMSNEFPPGPLDQAAVESRPDVLVYTTEPMTEDLEVTGRIRAVLHAATDAPSTDWVVRVCDVDPGGTSRNVVDGIVRSDAQPDEFTAQDVDLWSTSYVFRTGHRIRVQVTSSNFPRWARNFNTGEAVEDGTRARTAQQQIAHDAARPSRIILPVIPNGSA